jgi:hypothetical protein
MRSFLAPAVLTVLLTAAPLLANPPATAPETTAVRASDGAKDQTLGTATGEKVICRSDKEIGSRVKAKRICMTAKQWAEKTAEERQFIEQRQAQRTYSDGN